MDLEQTHPDDEWTTILQSISNVLSTDSVTPKRLATSISHGSTVYFIILYNH